MVLTRESLAGYSTQTYLMLVLLALVPQLIGHSALNLAVRTLPVTLVSVAILGEPVGATILGALIFGELPGSHEIAGGLLILAGIYLVMRRKGAKR
jgi:drug/metabolite transporter (DMT)-like permease